MTLEFDLYEKAATERLEPLRVALATEGVPVSFLPRHAAKAGELEKTGHIAIAFPASEGNLDRSRDMSQYVAVNMEVRISLSDRFQEIQSPQVTEATVNWALKQVIGLLVLYRLPVVRVKDGLLLTRHRFFGARGDRWEAMASFTFTVAVVPIISVDTSTYPVITRIEGEQRGDTLFIVRKPV